MHSSTRVDGPSSPMASNDARPAFDAASDRAALLRYVLEHTLERCSLPAGVSHMDDLNLKSIDVPALLASLREPRGRPDLRRCGPGDSGDTHQARDTAQDSIPGISPDPNPNGVPPVVSFESLGIAVPSLSLKTSTSKQSTENSTGPTPKRSLSLVRELPRHSESNENEVNALDTHLVGIAAPIPGLILPPLRGGGPFINDGGGEEDCMETKTTSKNLDDAIALCAFEVLIASMGDTSNDTVDVARTALELSPTVAEASAKMLAPHLSAARDETKQGTSARVHLRLMAEAAGCGSGESSEVDVFGLDPSTSGKARLHFVRRQLACLLETLWAAHDCASLTVRNSGGQSSGATDANDAFDDEDGPSHAPSVGAVIEEVGRLASDALSDEALLTPELDTESLGATVEALVEMIESSLDAVSASNATNAWRYPPALAGRTYAKLMDLMFDPLDEGALADDADETLGVVLGVGGVGDSMGINATARNAIFAWTLAVRYREAVVGDGLFTETGDKAQSLATRAYDRVVEAETEAEENDTDSADAHALLNMAKNVLSGPGYGQASVSKIGNDDVTLILTHAALGPLTWWTEGALCDFYKDVDVVAVELTRRLPSGPPVGGVTPPKSSATPAMTKTGFGAMLALGVASADARARVAAATSPGFDGNVAVVGTNAGHSLAARVCANSADEAYFRLKETADAYDFETAKARGVNHSSDESTDVAPGMGILAEGCACLADAFEAHLAFTVMNIAGPSVANTAPAALAERFGVSLSNWLSTTPPLDAGALRALANSRNFQNAVAAAVADRSNGEIGQVGDGMDIVDKVDKSFGGRNGATGVTKDTTNGVPKTTNSKKFEPFRLEERVAPMVFQWVAGRIEVTRRTTMRSLRAETWRGMSGNSSNSDFGVAFSAVELVRSAWDTLEAFWALQIPAPAAAMRALTEGLDGAFQEYAEFVTSSLGAPEDFAPELPVLTRYKKDVVDAKRKAFEKERTARREKGDWWGDFPDDARWGDGPERLAIGSFPKGSVLHESHGNNDSKDPVIPSGLNATLPQLCARVASLHFLLRSLSNLEREVPRRFEKMQRQQGVDEYSDSGDSSEITGNIKKNVYSNCDPTNPYGAKDPEAAWFDGLLDGARQTLLSCSKKVADYSACKIVYWDLRVLFIDGLYRGGVADGERAFSVVARLEAALSEIAERLPDGGGSNDTNEDTSRTSDTSLTSTASSEARDSVVHALLRATAQGYMWVMLDGGVGRVFGAGDSSALEEDLLELKELFTAGGEGVPEPAVKAVMKRAERLLMLMSLDTNTLCDAYLEQEERQNEAGVGVGANGLAASPGGGGDVGELDQDGGFGVSTLLRVLCHREDREASKFLKQNMQLPKSDEGSVMAFVTGKGNSAAAYFSKKYEQGKKYAETKKM